MKYFKFKIVKYFFLYNDFIGIVGEMYPEDFPLVHGEYFIKLVIDMKTVHVFKKIGEEIPFRTDPNVRIRAFRTSDKIKDLLITSEGKDRYIVGSQDEKVLDPDFNFM